MKVFLIILVLHGASQIDQREIPYENLANCAAAAVDIQKNLPAAWKTRERAVLAFCSDVVPNRKVRF